jgi:predicted nucleic acid-binding protein
MKFWDASAIVPLIVSDEPLTPLDREFEAGAMVVWWGTVVEIASALARKERDSNLPADEVRSSYDLLDLLARGWREVPPTDAVRRLSLRLLRVHTLRAADSLQLAAALTTARGDPGSLGFVCRDSRLAAAAAREGFRIMGAT